MITLVVVKSKETHEQFKARMIERGILVPASLQDLDERTRAAMYLSNAHAWRRLLRAAQS